MMNISESSGEPSCKRQENGDASSGSERPLKKARFAWQVKGKYHLKNDTPESSAAAPTHNYDEAGSSSRNNSDDLVGNTEQNLEILGDYLLKQDFNTLDSVITDSDKSLLKPSTSISPKKLDYPRYVSSYESSSSQDSPQATDSIRHGLIPMSMVVSQNYREDQCIARWQARQMAKGFVDNTINRVLDSWMYAPLPAGMDNNRFLALDVAEFINNLPGDNSIENEGILMAISAHGLQNNSSSSSNNDSHNEEPLCSSSSTKEDIFPSRSSSPIQTDEESKYETMDNNASIEENTGSLNDIMEWPFNEEPHNVSTPFSMFRDSSSPSYMNFSENDNLQNSSNGFEEINARPSSNNGLTSHFDFMDAAVSFAIQNKGLTSFGTDYG